MTGWERLAAFEGGTVMSLATATAIDGARHVFAATPVGVFRAVERPSYESGVLAQIKAQQDREGAGTLEALLYSGEVWQVGEDGAITRQGMGGGE